MRLRLGEPDLHRREVYPSIDGSPSLPSFGGSLPAFGMASLPVGREQQKHLRK